MCSIATEVKPPPGTIHGIQNSMVCTSHSSRPYPIVEGGWWDGTGVLFPPMSLGSATVFMETPEQAQAACEHATSQINDGHLPRTMEVTRVLDNDGLPSKGKLFVGQIPEYCTEADLRSVMGHFGTIEECTVLRDRDSQRGKGVL